MPTIIDEYGDYGLLNTEPGINYYFDVSLPVDGKPDTYEFLLVAGKVIEGDVTMVRRWPVEEFDERPDIKDIERMVVEKAKIKGGGKKS